MVKSLALEFAHKTSKRSLVRWSALAICLNLMFMTMTSSQSSGEETPRTKLLQKSGQIAPAPVALDPADQPKKPKTRCMPKKPCPATEGIQP